jgi:twinkle protein
VIVNHDEIKAKVLDLWKSGGLPKGSSTGWPSLDKFYTVGLGQWTCVTGSPNSGKSEWLDALLVNLAMRENWKFFIFSPENWPLALHHAKIIEKYIGKPFNPGPTPRMDEDDVEAAEEWMRGKFWFAKPERPDIVSIVSEAVNCASLSGNYKLGIVVDPWNQLEHYRPSNMTETEYISQTLSTVIDLVRQHNVHLWLVAHPAKMQPDKDGKHRVPTPRDIAGSAHFWNKADNCVTVYRDFLKDSNEVEVHVQKCRFKHIGRIGLATLAYDRVTGRYSGIPDLNVVRDYKMATAGDEPL